MRRKKLLLGAVLVLTFLTLSACGRPPRPSQDNTEDDVNTNKTTEATTEEAICGGNTNLTDYDAPKEINSEEITEFYAKFYSDLRFYDDQEGGSFYEFIIKEEGGELVASETNTGICCPVDDELMTNLQNCITENELAKKNGIYDVTAGLPPEYQPCVVDITYASGENIHFSYDNDPYEVWSEKMVDVFDEWFSAKGETALHIAEPGKVTSLFIDLYKDGIWYMYGGADVEDEKSIDGETHLLEKSISDVGEQKSLEGAYILFPDDYYDKIGEILDKYGVYRKYRYSAYSQKNGGYSNHNDGYFGWGTSTDAEEEDSDTYLSIEVIYENDVRVYIETKKMSEIEGLNEMMNELFEYHDSLFEDE